MPSGPVEVLPLQDQSDDEGSNRTNPVLSSDDEEDAVDGVATPVAAAGASGQPAAYMVSYVQGGHRSRPLRRLHRRGGCWRIPGQDYRDYEEYADLPDAGGYDNLCKQCFSGAGAMSSLLAASREADSESSEPDTDDMAEAAVSSDID